jgi:hypothetical protein
MKKCFLSISILIIQVAGYSQDFDIKRAVLFDSTVLHPFKVQETVKLSSALNDGIVKESDRLLIADFPARKIAFLYDQMAYHHVAFKDDAKAWMISFCLACNSGAGFYTKVGNINYHFEGAGLYDGMIILKDYQTGSYWNHITGECIYGKMKGKKLPSLNLLHSTVKDALCKSPNAEIAISDMSAYQSNPFYQLTEKTLPAYLPDPNKKDQANLGKQFLRTIAKEDSRLSNMTLGLGVWNDKNYRFYPSKAIDSANVIIEDFGGKRLVVYNNEASSVPFAFFTDAKNFTMKGNEIHLDNGFVITEKGIENKKRKIINPDKPLQMFTRWYGFALTFPVTTIYCNSCNK